MFDNLRSNLDEERRIVKEVNSLLRDMRNDEENRSSYVSCLSSLMYQLKFLNRAVPTILKEEIPLIQSKKKEEDKKKKQKIKDNMEIINISYTSPVSKEKSNIILKRSDEKTFLQQLKIFETNRAKLKRNSKKDDKFRKPLYFARISNKVFRKKSEKLAPKFDGLANDLKKGNIGVLLPTYISMAMMSILLSFFAGLLILGVMLYFNMDNLKFSWIPLALPLIAFTAFYLYPSGEASSVQKKISQELPFATIHMAAIAGANMEPTKIFKIIARSKEYPNIGAELRKVIVQIDLYGYDIVTSLKNVSKRSSNKKLVELFSGLATNISTGGGLKNFLEKKSENFLLDYRLERQKYSDLAGTFMDIYISILIAAPLVLMMMFIVMNVSGLGIGGLTIDSLLFLSVFGIVLVNIIFIFVLNFKQPKV